MNANKNRPIYAALIALATYSEPRAQATGPPVIERIDGSTLTCTIVSITETLARLECPESVTVPLDELRSIDYSTDGSESVGTATNETIFRLAAGGQMRGTITGESDESVIADTSFATALALPFATLAGLWFDAADGNSDARQMFDEAMANRLAGKDVLITHSGGEVAAIRGSVTALGPKGGRVLIGKTQRPFSLDRISGIVFAEGLGDPTRWLAHVTLTDGTELAGRLTGGDSIALRFQTPFEIEIEVPVKRIKRVRFDSERIVYLSDLNPSRSEANGLLHLPMPARFDRSASNRPLSIEGRRYDKGIGVHAHSLLSYDVQGAYESIAATVGIDDAVRPRGSVVFKLEGDGRLLFDSNVITGSDPARSFTADLRGINKLELVVEYATDMDLSDHADWADIRLIKPFRARSASDGSTAPK